MQRTELEELINENLSSRQIAKIVNKSQSTVKYWLQKYNLKTKYRKYNKQNFDCICKICGEKKEKEDFYKGRHYCKFCDNKRVWQKQKATKKKIIEHMGGGCKCCNYNKCSRSLDLHHLDSSKKDANFNSINGWKWDRIKKELDRCILVCRNCHGEIHEERLLQETRRV